MAVAITVHVFSVVTVSNPQNRPINQKPEDMAPGAHSPDKRLPTMMTTADMALKVDPSYNAICQKFRADPAYFADVWARAWYKLNDVRNTSGTGWVGISAVLDNPTAYPTQMAILRGDPGFVSGPQALRVRNNNRAYESEGIQSVLTARFSTGDLAHQLEVSARRHTDSEDRFQRDDVYRMDDGDMLLTTRGVDGAQANRVGEAEAWAFFVRDVISVDRLTLTPGLRYETIDLTRTDYPTSPPSRTAPTRVIESNVDVWLPGLGLTYDLTDEVRLVAGAHRGFAHPGGDGPHAPRNSQKINAFVINGLLRL